MAVDDGDRFPASAAVTLGAAAGTETVAFSISTLRNAGDDDDDDDDDDFEVVPVEAVAVAVFILASSIALVLSCSPSSLRT